MIQSCLSWLGLINFILTLEFTRNTTRMNVASRNGRYFNEKTLTARPLDSKFNHDEKEEVLKWRNTSLRQVKS